MAKVPGASSAIIDARKVADYLLNDQHRQNGGKAALFQAFGFARESWQVLSSALRQHLIDNEVAETSISEYGTKYSVSCHLRSPDGRNPCLTSIWIIEPGASPRLVTAYR